jgi:hypothetical protein
VVDQIDGEQEEHWVAPGLPCRGRRGRTARGLLTPEERARIAELQELLIDRFVKHRGATADGQEERVKTLEAEIDDLLREKEEVEKWATVGSA